MLQTLELLPPLQRPPPLCEISVLYQKSLRCGAESCGEDMPSRTGGQSPRTLDHEALERSPLSPRALTPCPGGLLRLPAEVIGGRILLVQSMVILRVRRNLEWFGVPSKRKMQNERSHNRTHCCCEGTCSCDQRRERGTFPPNPLLRRNPRNKQQKQQRGRARDS